MKSDPLNSGQFQNRCAWIQMKGLMSDLGRIVACKPLLVWVFALVTVPASLGAIEEDGLRRLYLGVVEQAVTDAEPLWTDTSAQIPNSGFFDFRKYSDWDPAWYPQVVTVPGNGEIVFCYSVLLTETRKETFGRQQLSRKTLLDRCVKAIRWCCLTSAYVEKPYDFLPTLEEHGFCQGRQWKRELGYRADIVGWITLAAAKLWDELDPDTRKQLEAVCVGGAASSRTPYSWTAFGGGNRGGNHDQVKQDLSSTMGAAYLFPGRPGASLYQAVVQSQGIDMVSTMHDYASGATADGKPVSAWARGWNLYQDYSSDHHGQAQVWYGVDKLFEGRFYVDVLSSGRGLPVPETFTYNGNGFDGILEWSKVLSLPEGEPASIHGMEYDSYYGAGLLSYCYGAVRRQDAVAAVLEERAARLLQKHIAAVREYDYHRNSYAKAALAYLVHKTVDGQARRLSAAEAFQQLEGTYYYRWQNDLIHRDPDKWVSFSWGAISGRKREPICGYVVPTRAYAQDLEPLVYFHPESLLGRENVVWRGAKPRSAEPIVSYEHRRNDVGFSTAGRIQKPGFDRVCAFFSFERGPCVLLTQFRLQRSCRFSFSGLPVFFYARDGVANGHRYSDAEGSRVLGAAEHRHSSWWCVDNSLGGVVLEGNSDISVQKLDGYNWARTVAYRDKCDAVYLSPIQELDGPAGGTVLDLGAAFYTGNPGEQVALVDKIIQSSKRQPSCSVTKGWKWAVLPDGALPQKRYFAAANFSAKEETANLKFSFGEGAPILDGETVVTGHTGETVVTLPSLGTLSAVCELYAEGLNSDPFRASKLDSRHYRLAPIEGRPVRVRIRYFGDSAESLKIVSEDAHVVGTTSVSSGTLEKTMIVDLDKPVVLELCGGARPDRLGPAVEIDEVRLEPGGAARVEVQAEDQSGISSVELYCDGGLIGQRSTPPFVWSHRPGSGFHTFFAAATDASDFKNRRVSFKRTVKVSEQEHGAYCAACGAELCPRGQDLCRRCFAAGRPPLIRVIYSTLSRVIHSKRVRATGAAATMVAAMAFWLWWIGPRKGQRWVWRRPV